MGLFLIALATLLTAIALVATFRVSRAPGMTNEQLPLFAQSVGIFATALLVLAPISLLGTRPPPARPEEPGLVRLVHRQRRAAWSTGTSGCSARPSSQSSRRAGARSRRRDRGNVPPRAARPPPSCDACTRRGRRPHRPRTQRRHRRGQPPGLSAGLSSPCLPIAAAAGTLLARRRLAAARTSGAGQPRCLRPRIARRCCSRSALCRPRARRLPRRPERDDVRSAQPTTSLWGGRAARAARRSRLLVAEAHRQAARRAPHQPLRLRDRRLVGCYCTRRAIAGWNDQPTLAGVTIDGAGTRRTT